ncbi:MAG: hypothetical protein V1645_00975 [archaeon]
MDSRLIITALIAFLLSFIILKLLAKTFKFVVFIVVFVVVFGVMYFGYDAFVGKVTDKVGGLGSVETVVPASQGCSSDPDCAFITSPSDCNLVANACNNLRDSSKFFKPSTKAKCAIDSVVIDTGVRCGCRNSVCQRL